MPKNVKAWYWAGQGLEQKQKVEGNSVYTFRGEGCEFQTVLPSQVRAGEPHAAATTSLPLIGSVHPGSSRAAGPARFFTLFHFMSYQTWR